MKIIKTVNIKVKYDSTHDSIEIFHSNFYDIRVCNENIFEILIIAFFDHINFHYFFIYIHSSSA